MIARLTKLTTFALILSLSIMQVFVPFLHAHYNSDSVHAEGATLLHLHAAEFDVTTIERDATSTTQIKPTQLSNHLETGFLSIDAELPNQNDFNTLTFIAVEILTFIFCSTLIRVITCRITKSLLPDFLSAWSLTRAPPHYS